MLEMGELSEVEGLFLYLSNGEQNNLPIGLLRLSESCMSTYHCA